MKRLRQIGMLAILIVGISSMASASTATFDSWSYSYTANAAYAAEGNSQNGYSQDSNGYAMDEHYASVWYMNNITAITGGGTITGATITINNIVNYNSSANELFMHLFNTATNSGITVLQTDKNTGQDPIPPPFTDYLNPANYPTTANSVPYNAVGNTINNLIPSGDTNTYLNDGTATYNGVGMNPNNVTFPADPGNGDGANFVYTFSGADLTALIAYIAANNDIALGFSPDCHFYNDGIVLQLTYTPSGGSGHVPEPATLTLMAVGLAGMMSRKLRRAKV